MAVTEAIRWQAGLHVVGTSLWCDALRPRGACFVSSLNLLLGDRRGVKQLIVSTDIGGAIEALKLVPAHAVLPVRPYRPFLLGRARVEVLETGEPCEAALCVEVDGRRVVYVDALPAGAVTLRDADVLVVGRALAAEPVNTIDHMVKQIDDRVARGEKVELVVRDLAWLPRLATLHKEGVARALRLSPQLAAIAPFVAPTLQSNADAAIGAGLRGGKTALVLDKIPADVANVAALADAIGAKTVYTTTTPPTIAGVRTKQLGRPTQLGLF